MVFVGCPRRQGRPITDHVGIFKYQGHLVCVRQTTINTRNIVFDTDSQAVTDRGSLGTARDRK